MNQTEQIKELINKSHWLRKELFELLATAKKGHIPSSYSCAEIVIALYYAGYLKVDPKNPKSMDRDRLFISKGHAAMVLYPILADLGFFSKNELQNFTKSDGILRLYADPSIPGIESVTGSLGHALGIAAGFALSAKRDNLNYNSYVILGDGECYEGSIWETAMFANHHELNNLIAIVDRNQYCIIGETEKCIKLDSLEDKFRSFGWNSFSINGHSYNEIIPALEKVKTNNKNKPTAIIANTVKGKGISFMEGDPLWHNKIPNDEQIQKAREALKNNCIFN